MWIMSRIKLKSRNLTLCKWTTDTDSFFIFIFQSFSSFSSSYTIYICFSLHALHSFFPSPISPSFNINFLPFSCFFIFFFFHFPFYGFKFLLFTQLSKKNFFFCIFLFLSFIALDSTVTSGLNCLEEDHGYE